MSLVPDYDSDSDSDSGQTTTHIPAQASSISKLTLNEPRPVDQTKQNDPTQTQTQQKANTITVNVSKKRKRVIAVQDLNQENNDEASHTGENNESELPNAGEQSQDLKKPKVSIASFLPAPKNRRALQKPVVSASSAKNKAIINGSANIEVATKPSEPTTETAKSKSHQGTSIDIDIPMSEDTSAMPSLFSFDSTSNAKNVREAVSSYGPSVPSNIPAQFSIPQSSPSQMNTTNPSAFINTTSAPKEQSTSSGKPKRRDPFSAPEGIDTDSLVTFNVDEFYQSNLDAHGGATQMAGHQINRPVRAVASGKHQLSSLIKSAQENREGLEEMFANNRKTKKEIGSKYGFK